ncbi:hypothetical protein AM500_22725 [Bacillus sp. FJAT-18017]|uniref:flagellar hook-basal body protein n=1 Tax=Bacillus sp. FJAT-18017 TaxID=1705566 RepID=UPI0006AE3FC2|nr:flagellar hook-basal body protein [Bacillus sp. FJAT-18017]ALC92271.1 hypothetical protein AM500_22725 [Bacillus sp. FJAT-18017]
MIRGLYSAASGMFAMERKQEALSNNLANAQTPGFKKDDATLRSFPNMLISRIRDYEQIQAGATGIKIPGQPALIGELSNGVYAQERVPSFLQGSLVETGLPLDVAINDQALPLGTVNGRQVKTAAFFTVQLSDGTVGYTRNGKWDVDANGQLVTSEGYRILGSDGQPIQLNAGLTKEDIRISSEGQITLYPGRPEQTADGGQVGVAVANNPSELRRFGGSVFVADAPLQVIDVGNNPGFSLNQGFIEQSNVDLGQTMTDMMTVVRSYEANQKVVGAYDRSLEQLNTIGRVNG